MADQVPVTILVADDNPATRYSTSRFLRAAGFTILEAGNGTEALALAEQLPNMVILDVNMPDIDGFEVCRRLRRQTKTSQIPVVHLSATFVADADKIRGLEAGADGYLTHPVEPPVLIATVNAFLRARRAEEGMRRSEEKFRAVYDQALNGISLLDEGFLYIDVNPAMCRVLGREASKIIGKHSSAFIPKSHEHQLSVIAEQLKTHGHWRGSYPLVHADGSLVYLDWSISRHALPGVNLAIVTDISERVRITAERESLLESERSARAEAEKANRLKDDFLATLSHELRTPLNAIVGWAYLLQQEPLSAEDLREGIEAIQRNATMQTQLISDLLDVSRITSGKMRLELQNIDAVALIHAALESMAPAAAMKEITIVRNFGKDVGPVYADPSRLQQIIWNLVSNAVKFTPRNGTITVALRRFNSQIEISVADTGQGMSAEFIPHLFERFRQAEGGTRRNQGGLGLGLAIVKHLVEMHGGTVAAESPGEGLGSTLTVRLPFAAVQESSSPEDNPPPTAVELIPNIPVPKLLSGTRVLVVDDDPDARTLLGRVLRAAGAETAEAASVQEALAMVTSFEPDVLISDIGMPGEDGHDLIRALRKRGQTAAMLPAIAVTAFARGEDQKQSLLAGYQVHLAKPVTPPELVNAVASLTT